MTTRADLDAILKTGKSLDTSNVNDVATYNTVLNATSARLEVANTPQKVNAANANLAEVMAAMQSDVATIKAQAGEKIKEVSLNYNANFDGQQADINEDLAARSSIATQLTELDKVKFFSNPIKFIGAQIKKGELKEEYSNLAREINAVGMQQQALNAEYRNDQALIKNEVQYRINAEIEAKYAAAITKSKALFDNAKLDFTDISRDVQTAMQAHAMADPNAVASGNRRAAESVPNSAAIFAAALAAPDNYDPNDISDQTIKQGMGVIKTLDAAEARAVMFVSTAWDKAIKDRTLAPNVSPYDFARKVLTTSEDPEISEGLNSMLGNPWEELRVEGKKQALSAIQSTGPKGRGGKRTKEEVLATMAVDEKNPILKTINTVGLQKALSNPVHKDVVTGIVSLYRDMSAYGSNSDTVFNNLSNEQMLLEAIPELPPELASRLATIPDNPGDSLPPHLSKMTSMYRALKDSGLSKEDVGARLWTLHQSTTLSGFKQNIPGMVPLIDQSNDFVGLMHKEFGDAKPVILMELPRISSDRPPKVITSASELVEELIILEKFAEYNTKQTAKVKLNLARPQYAVPIN